MGQMRTSRLETAAESLVRIQRLDEELGADKTVPVGNLGYLDQAVLTRANKLRGAEGSSPKIQQTNATEERGAQEARGKEQHGSKDSYPPKGILRENSTVFRSSSVDFQTAIHRSGSCAGYVPSNSERR